MNTKRCFILLLTTLFLFSGKPAMATGDAGNTLQNLFRNIQQLQEIIKNAQALTEMDNLLKILGEKGGVALNMVDMKSKLTEAVNPAVLSELRGIVSQGQQAIPQIKAHVQTSLELIQNNVKKLEEIKQTANAQLAVSSLEALKLGKSMEALGNKGFEEAAAQLKQVAGTGNLQERMAQASTMNIQSMEREVSINQLKAKALEAYAAQDMMRIETEAAEELEAGQEQTQAEDTAGGTDS